MRQILLIIFCFAILTVSAQKVHFNSGSHDLPSNAGTFSSQDWSNATFNGKKYAIVQFNKSVSADERATISQQTGLIFFDYIPRYAFIAAIPNSINDLSAFDVKSVVPYVSAYKVSHLLIERPLPNWIDLGNGRIQIDVTFHNDIYKSMIEYQLGNLGIEVLSWQEENLAVVALPENQLNLLAAKPFVKYMQPTSAPAEIENDEGRTSTRTNVLDAEYLQGLHFIGNGIAVSMGDDGNVGPHIDFQGRLTNLASGMGGTHGDHVMGIIGSAGNQDPTARGHAPGASLIAYSNYNNLQNATTDYLTRGVRITANSLGQTCNSGYNNNARTQDQYINANYSLISVHSAGNDGTSNCGFVNGYYQITGGYKAGKNCLATGNLLKDDELANSSSRGPARDGRIKPDLCAVGTSVNSTQPNNSYAVLSGTSMACPGLAGTLASLWEAYKVNNAGQDPYSALMKGIALNTADDLGRPGPDFQFGWGRINAKRVVEVIQNKQYILDTIDNGQTDVHQITVPANIAQVKFMLYYHDEPGAANAAIPLVNDLNLLATAPNTFVFQPWVLNYTQTTAALTSNAVRGRDSVNNAEQVSVKNPQPGTWNISISSFDVPQGPQPYVLVYYFEPRGITLTYPQGGEHFNAGVTERIRWDANDINLPITLEYSSDNGLNWNVISSNIPSDDRHYDWTPPSSLATGEMQMRISRGTQSDVTDANFTVFRQVQNVVVDTACPTQFHLSWDAVSGATDYTVYQLGNKFMDSVGNTTTNGIYLTNNVNTNGTYYFAVRANISSNGAQGRRSLAYEKLPGQVNCGDDIVNLRTEMPFYKAYDCAPIGSVPVTITVRNQSLTGAIISNIPVSYTVNGVLTGSDTIAGPILVGDSVVHTFTTQATFPGAGIYQVRTRCSYQYDAFLQNDTSSRIMNIINIGSTPPPVVQDFEGNFLPNGWLTDNPDNGIPWQKTFTLSGAVQGNTHAAYMDFYNYTNVGAEDILETPVIDLSNVTTDSVIMSFDIAYAQRMGREDRLRLIMSEDCGQTWVPTGFDKGGSQLATALSSNSIFSPTLTNQWRNERIDLSGQKGKKIILRFVGTNDNGNNLYLDNINIMLKDGAPLGVSQLDKNEQYVVYPNPSNGKYVLRTNFNTSKVLYMSIKDMNGKIITKSRMPLHAGITQSAIDITYLPNGIYMLQLFDGENTQTIRLTKK